MLTSILKKQCGNQSSINSWIGFIIIIIIIIIIITPVTPKGRVLLPHPCGVVVAGAVGSQKVLKKDDDANDHDGPDEDDDEEDHE